MNIRITMVLHEGIRHLKTTKRSVEDKLHDICKELRQNKPQWRNLSAIDCENCTRTDYPLCIAKSTEVVIYKVTSNEKRVMITTGRSCALKEYFKPQVN